MGYFPSLSRAPGQGAERQPPPRRRDRAGRRGPGAAARLHRRRARAGAWPTARLGDLDAAIATLRARASRWATRPSRYSATVGAGTFHARNILAETLIDAGRLDEAAAQLEHVLEHHPAVRRRRRALRPRPAAPRHAGRRGRRARRRAGPGADARPALPAGRPVLRGRPRSPRPRRSCARSSRPSPARTPRASRSPRPCCRAATSPRPRRASPLEVPADAPHAPAAAQTARLRPPRRPSDRRRASTPRFAYARERRPRLRPARRADRLARRAPARRSSSRPRPRALVAAMLESLARLERFDEFEALAGVVDRLDLALARAARAAGRRLPAPRLPASPPPASGSAWPRSSAARTSASLLGLAHARRRPGPARRRRAHARRGAPRSPRRPPEPSMSAAARTARPFDDPTIGRTSMPLLKGLSGTPMTGETGAGGSGTSRTYFERIDMDIDATTRIGHGAFLALPTERRRRLRQAASSRVSSTSPRRASAG